MKLPSRHQIGDTIRAGGQQGIVTAVTFTDYGKVLYDIRNKRGTVLTRMLSEEVDAVPKLTVVDGTANHRLDEPPTRDIPSPLT